MSVTLSVKVAEISVKTVPLTVKLFKQLPEVSFDGIRHLLRRDTGGVQPDAMPGSTASQYFIGWVSGAAVGTESDDKWLIVKLDEAKYARFRAMPETVKGVQQIFIL